MRISKLLICLILVCLVFGGCVKENSNELAQIDNNVILGDNEQAIVVVDYTTDEIFTLPLDSSEDRQYSAARLAPDDSSILLINDDYTAALYDLNSTGYRFLDFSEPINETEGIMVVGLANHIDWFTPDNIVIPIYNIIYNIERDSYQRIQLPNSSDRYAGSYIDHQKRAYYVFITTYEHDLFLDSPRLAQYDINGKLTEIHQLPIEEAGPAIVGEVWDNETIFGFFSKENDMFIHYINKEGDVNYTSQINSLTFAYNPAYKVMASVDYHIANEEMLVGDVDNNILSIYGIDGAIVHAFQKPMEYMETILIPEGILWASGDEASLYAVYTEERNQITHIFKASGILEGEPLFEEISILPYLCYLSGIDSSNNLYLLCNRPTWLNE